MSELKCEKQTVITVDAMELSEYICQEYKRDSNTYDVVADLELGNDEDKEIWVQPSLDAYGMSKLKDFMAGKWPYMITYKLLNDLCMQGKIEAGNYLIKVCW